MTSLTQPDPPRFWSTAPPSATRVNVATFALGRDRQGGSAIALVEVDSDIPAAALAKIQVLPGVKAGKVLRF